MTDVPELYNTFLYDKVIIGVDGVMEISDYPIECFIGRGWKYYVYHKNAAVAFAPTALDEPLNLFWEAARSKHHPPLHGTVVLFRHNAHIRISDIYPGYKAVPPRFNKCVLL